MSFIYGNIKNFAIKHPVTITLIYYFLYLSILLYLIKELYMKYRIYIEQDEDGMFTAEVPSLPGCISQGKTRAELIQNIKEAISGYLESLRKHGEPVPPAITEEIIEI